MGEALAARFDFVSSLFEEISRRSGVDLASTFFGEGAANLHADLPAQVGVFAVSMAVLEVLEKIHGARPSAVTGYSLGTYAAFAAAGALERGAALDVLLEAERLLGAARKSAGVEGTMGFVIGLSKEEVEGLIAEVMPDPTRLSIGTENAARQFVLTGDRDAVVAAIERARPKALKADLLKIGFPMHSTSLTAVCEGLQSFLEGNKGRGKVPVRQPAVPLYAPMLGRRVESSAEATLVLSKQISRRSLWSSTLRAMGTGEGGAGFTRFAELGPGDVLTKMLRWTLRDATCTPLEDSESIERFMENLSLKVNTEDGLGAPAPPARGDGTQSALSAPGRPRSLSFEEKSPGSTVTLAGAPQARLGSEAK